MVVVVSSFAVGLVLAATTALAGMRLAEMRHDRAVAEQLRLELRANRAAHFSALELSARCQDPHFATLQLLRF